MFVIFLVGALVMVACLAVQVAAVGLVARFYAKEEGKPLGPRPIIELWNREMRRAGSAPEITKRLHAIGMTAAPSGSPELEGLIKQQMAVVEKLVKVAGLKSE